MATRVRANGVTSHGPITRIVRLPKPDEALAMKTPAGAYAWVPRYPQELLGLYRCNEEALMSILRTLFSSKVPAVAFWWTIASDTTRVSI
jgi:hypothetical protein